MNFTYSVRTLPGGVVAFFASVSIFAVSLAAQVAGPSSAPNSSGSIQASTKRRPASRSAKKTLRVSRTSRAQSYRYRLARLHPLPQRVAEIQRALIQAGYLHQEASGKWDEATREAMRRFQEERGFPATGLPEAKSLMKLGLGPHPLPDDVDPSAAPRASVNPKPNSPGDPLEKQPGPEPDPKNQ